MAETYGTTTRLDAAKASIISAAGTILGQEGARAKLITFSTNVVADYGWTSDVSEFDGNVSSMPSAATCRRSGWICRGTVVPARR